LTRHTHTALLTMTLAKTIAIAAALSMPLAAPSVAAPAFLDEAFAGTTRQPFPEPVETVADTASGGAILHHLPAARDALRFNGEIASKSWPVFIAPGQAGKPAKFKLSFVNAVSVMPETSHLSVFVNEMRVATLPLDAPTADSDHVIDIPADLLRAGYNAVRLEARQRHRVDCSIAGTYELWTQVDPSETGFIFAAENATVRDLASLPALPLGAGGVAHLRAILPPGASADAIGRTLKAIEHVAVIGSFTRPFVDIAPEPGEGPGLDIIAATDADLAAFEPDLQARIATTMPIGFVDGGATGRSILVIRGRTAEDLDHSIGDLAARGAAIVSAGTQEGQTALAGLQGFRLAENTEMPIGQFGIHAQEFNGRLFRASFDVTMPPDFYAADYGKLEIALAAGYMGGLAEGAQATVRVNDKIAAGLPLTDRQGEVFKDRTIGVPLTFFRPGINRIDLDVQLQTEDDRHCDPLAGVDAPPRFALLKETTIKVPGLARIAHMPNLAAMTTSGFPYRQGEGTAKLYVPYPDAVSIGAAATLMARLAVAAGAPIAADLALEMPDGMAGSAIIVGAFNDLAPSVVASAGLEVENLRAAWRRYSEPRPTVATNDMSPDIDPIARRFAALRQNQEIDWTTTGSIIAPRQVVAAASEPALPGAVSPTPGPSFEAWRDAVSERRSSRDFIRAAARWIDTTIDLSARDFGFGGNRALAVAPTPSTNVVVAQAQAPDARGTWTLVTAPSKEALRDGIDTLVEPAIWNALSDRAGSYDVLSENLVTYDTTQTYYVATQPFSIGNSRRIAAGWFSHHIAIYVVALFVLAAFIAATAQALLKRAGHRS